MERILGLIIIACLVGIALYSINSQPPPEIEGKTPIQYDFTQLHWKWKKDNEGKGILEIYSSSTNELLGSFAVSDNNILHTDPKEESKIVARYKPHEYLGKWNFDLGVWAGWDKEDNKPEVGLRISPARLLFGTVAPDAIISDDSAGVGVSIFPPDRLLSDPWDNFGVGCWYTVDLHDDRDPGLIFGLSYSVSH